MLALVTGGSRGIGLGVVKALLDNDYNVLVTARKVTEELNSLMKELPGRVDFLSVDNSKPEDFTKLQEYLKTKYDNRLDLLVNNAGVAPKVRKDMLEISREDYDYVININQKGTFFMSQLAANIMKENKSGRIVNVSSLSSYTASVERAEYCIAKAGISMITKLFAARMAEFNVGVFEISPGIIQTDMTKGVMEKYTKLINDGITPIKRFGQPSDIANAIIAIAKGYLDFSTGTVIHVDGGFNIRRL